MVVVMMMSSMSMTVSSSNTVRVSGSWDISQQRLPYNRNAPRKPPKPSNTLTFTPTPTPTPTPTTTTSPSLTLTAQSVSKLLRKHSSILQEVGEKLDDSYLGYDTWVPRPPKVEKPRSVYNAAALAYIGDGVYELYARRHFLFPPLSIEEYNDRVMAVVRCEAQDALLQKLVGDKVLTAEERDILRWGKNVGSSKTRTKKRAGVAVYNRASSFETLVGYLYLTNVNRLEEIMSKLGFSTGSSGQPVLEEANSQGN